MPVGEPRKGLPTVPARALARTTVPAAQKRRKKVADHTTPTEEDEFLDRFQGIFRNWPLREVDFDEKVENPDSLEHVVADVWLKNTEIDHLEAVAKKNGGSVVGVKPECP